jgi:Xaa-Pro aminopeptidase
MTIGATEVDVARAIASEFARRGGVPVVTLVRFGRNGVAGQVRPTMYRLKAGDQVWCDVMGTKVGFWADIARTYFVGDPIDRASTMYRALLEGLDVAVASARPGMAVKDLFALTVDAVRAAGIASYRRHHVGHGIGLDVYDDPILTGDSAEEIENGAVLSIETPYYEFGLGALHVEDPVVLNADGATRLTERPRDLTVLGV